MKTGNLNLFQNPILLISEYGENLCFDSAQQPVIEQSRNTG